MADANESPVGSPRRTATFPKSPMRETPPSTASQQRLPSQGKSSTNETTSSRSFAQRRSSVLSFSSLDDAAQSFRDEILHPRSNDHKVEKDDEVTNWHSSPLAFAILPAAAGLIFQNGSQFVTDALLLGLAAIFMNWSIRLPWDWYYSAQAVARDVQPYFGEAIVDDPEEAAVDMATSATDPSNHRASERDSDDAAEPAIAPQELVRRELAGKELRRQELLALMATFIFPVGAAYLLHLIRAQLSRPSTGLVSDYNLSIFLLAAEIRPFRQLIRLMSNRTLHLQRTVTGIDNPFANSTEDKMLVRELSSRLAELETRLSDQSLVSANVAQVQKSGVNELTLEIKKRYEPRFEGLERAVRRYEKRSATLAMLTEQRLQALEGRVNDAFSLAAVAAKHSQNHGVVSWTVEQTGRLVVIPLKLTFNLATWPFAAVDAMYVQIKSLVLGPVSAKRAKMTSTDGARGKTNVKKSGR